MQDAEFRLPELAALYDTFSAWSEDRQFYLDLAGPQPIRIVDFGCGTGLICNAYAEQGHEVTGVDPTETMLTLARQQPHGSDINWVLSDLQSFASDSRFDLAIMTGHAFQTLLTDDDILAGFRVVRNCLTDDGRFVFETRNPALDWVEGLTYDRTKDADGVPVRDICEVLWSRDEQLKFQHRFQFPDKELLSESVLRFTDKDTLDRLAAEAGLAVTSVFGDWSLGAFFEDSSEEIIFVLKPA